MFTKFFLFFASVVILRAIFIPVRFEENKELNIKAFVISDPKVSGNKQRLSINGIDISLPAEPKVYYGDKIEIQGIYKEGKIENAKVLQKQPSKLLFPTIKQKLISFFQESLPEPYASLASGIVLGAKSDLPYDLRQSLIKTSTTHVVVASGMNVVIISGFFLSILVKLCSRIRASIIATFLMWGYVTIIGFEAPLIRAAIMVSIANLAVLSGRRYSVMRALLLTIVVILFLNPFWIGDIGFWLSVTSTFSLIILEPKINSKLSFVPEILREGLSTSLAAQLGTLPIILLVFGRTSLIGPFVNAITLWVIAPVSIGGTIACLIGLIVPFIGRLILLLLYPLLWWFVTIISLA